MKPRVCLISTVSHNVGDDFVREGLVWLLGKVMGDIETRVVHKHFPVSARGAWARKLDALTRRAQQRLPVRLALSKMADAMPLNARADAVLSSDVVVQCGAPVYWKNRFSDCAGTEWFGPLIERRWRRIRNRVPLLNLGAGSCQAFSSDGSEVWEDPRCAEFIRQFTEAASLTTVRDSLAQQIVRQCSREVPLLPCPSIFAPHAAKVSVSPGESVALNYMPAGGHFDLEDQGRGIRALWEQRFAAAARDLARRHPCVLICHDQGEHDEAARLLPEIPRRLALDWRDCLQAYADCRFALVNRVHGGVVAAAMGKPVLLIGNDSRVLTGALVPGIQTLPVSAGQEEFAARLEELQSRAPAAHLATFLRKAEADYLGLLKPLSAR